MLLGAGNVVVSRPAKSLADDALLTASGWPWKGGIYFRRAVLRYREDTDPILQVGNRRVKRHYLLLGSTLLTWRPQFQRHDF